MAVKKKKTVMSPTDNMQHYMKIVTLDTCLSCTQQCARGLDYIDRMSKPGAIGYGVPCILTKGSGLKEKRPYKKK